MKIEYIQNVNAVQSLSDLIMELRIACFGKHLKSEDLEQADRALINKVYHMLFDIGSDFESVIRMLYSFRNGPKSGIKVADPEDNYEWTNKDGNEKYSTKNLPKAHFRWDWRRYTLSKESVDKITEFVDTILES